MTAGARAWQANDSTKKPETASVYPRSANSSNRSSDLFDADADVAQGDRVAVDADPKPNLQRAPRQPRVVVFSYPPPDCLAMSMAYRSAMRTASSGAVISASLSLHRLDLTAPTAALGVFAFAVEKRLDRFAAARTAFAGQTEMSMLPLHAA